MTEQVAKKTSPKPEELEYWRQSKKKKEVVLIGAGDQPNVIARRLNEGMPGLLPKPKRNCSHPQSCRFEEAGRTWCSCCGEPVVTADVTLTNKN